MKIAASLFAALLVLGTQAPNKFCNARELLPHMQMKVDMHQMTLDNPDPSRYE